ncbi:MAG: MarR family winged helix-turn-helix transcriptional regulator [Syntrophomonadaceae bacterium]
MNGYLELNDIQADKKMRLEEEIKQDRFSSQYHKALVNIIYTNNWIASHMTAILKPHGITMQQYNVLRILRGCNPKPATIKLIKERMLDKMSDASRIVEKLRAKNLAERSECSKDRRNVDVTITQKGLDLLAKLDAPEHLLENRLAALDSEEINSLNCLLDKIRG